MMHKGFAKEFPDAVLTAGCTPLLVSEVGSRPLGIERVSSDYDYRMIYRQTNVQYLNPYRRLPDNSTLGIQVPNVDFDGCDLFKAAQMVVASNATIIEWLRGRVLIAFPSREVEVLREYIEDHGDYRASMYAYYGFLKRTLLSDSKVLETVPTLLKRKLLQARFCCYLQLLANTEKPLTHDLSFVELLEVLPIEPRRELLNCLECYLSDADAVPSVHAFNRVLTGWVDQELKLPAEDLVDDAVKAEFYDRLIKG